MKNPNKKIAYIYVGTKLIYETDNPYKAYKFFEKLIKQGVNATFGSHTVMNNQKSL